VSTYEFPDEFAFALSVLGFEFDVELFMICIQYKHGRASE